MARLVDPRLRGFMNPNLNAPRQQSADGGTTRDLNNLNQGLAATKSVIQILTALKVPELLKGTVAGISRATEGEAPVKASEDVKGILDSEGIAEQLGQSAFDAAADDFQAPKVPMPQAAGGQAGYGTPQQEVEYFKEAERHNTLRDQFLRERQGLAQETKGESVGAPAARKPILGGPTEAQMMAQANELGDKAVTRLTFESLMDRAAKGDVTALDDFDASGGHGVHPQTPWDLLTGAHITNARAKLRKQLTAGQKVATGQAQQRLLDERAVTERSRQVVQAERAKEVRAREAAARELAASRKALVGLTNKRKEMEALKGKAKAREMDARATKLAAEADLIIEKIDAQMQKTQDAKELEALKRAKMKAETQKQWALKAAARARASKDWAQATKTRRETLNPEEAEVYNELKVRRALAAAEKAEAEARRSGDKGALDKATLKLRQAQYDKIVSDSFVKMFGSKGKSGGKSGGGSDSGGPDFRQARSIAEKTIRAAKEEARKRGLLDSVLVEKKFDEAISDIVTARNEEELKAAMEKMRRTKSDKFVELIRGEESKEK